MTGRDYAILTAEAYLGTPYHWGGDDPMEGFDCSGFAIELCRTGGKLPLEGDWTAEGLYQFYRALGEVVSSPCAGCLVFFCGKDGKAFHVEFCLNDEFSIGAAGGNSSTSSEEIAISQNAYIRIRPIHRGDAVLKYVNPFIGDVAVEA